MLPDCLVKPWELSCMALCIVPLPQFPCKYEDPSPGPFDSHFPSPLRSSCSSLLSLLLRIICLFYCRTTFATIAPARTLAPKAHRPIVIRTYTERQLCGSCIK